MQYFSSIMDGMIYFFDVFITVKYQIKVDQFNKDLRKICTGTQMLTAGELEEDN